MRDEAHEWTDEQIAALVERIRLTYRSAQIDVQGKLDQFMRRFRRDETKFREKMEKGEITPETYRDWLAGQVFQGKHWRAMLSTLTDTLTHAASADTQNGGKITPYTQEVPYQSRAAYLNMMRTSIYEAFGVMDAASIAAGSKTATEINAAYQAMDDKADDYEYQIAECVRQLLALQGIDDYPQFKRNRISNQYEQVQMIMLEAEYLDEETVLNKLPNITPDEVDGIMQRKGEQERSRFMRDGQPEE